MHLKKAQKAKLGSRHQFSYKLLARSDPRSWLLHFRQMDQGQILCQYDWNNFFIINCLHQFTLTWNLTPCHQMEGGFSSSKFMQTY